MTKKPIILDGVRLTFDPIKKPTIRLAELEKRVFAAMVASGEASIVITDEGTIFIDLESSGGQLAGAFAVPTVERTFEKPMKQNGRSAEYLKHDPTKRHRR